MEVIIFDLFVVVVYLFVFPVCVCVVEFLLFVLFCFILSQLFIHLQGLGRFYSNLLICH